MPGSNVILLKRSDTPNAVPSVTALSAGEVAINTADGKLFFKKINSGVEEIVTFTSSVTDNNSPYVYVDNLSAVNTTGDFDKNTVSQSFAVVLGGYNNDNSGGGSTVINGENNDINGDFALIGGGLDNLITSNGDYGAILGGKDNTLDHNESFIIGSNITSHSEGFAYVNNLSATNTVYSEEFGYNSTERPDLTGVKQALDELLYVTPVFNSLTVVGGNSLEVGQTLTTPNVSWTTNKTFTSITLTFPGGTTSSGNGSFLSTSDPSTYTYASSTGSRTWSVQGSDWKSATANRSTTVNWYYKVYMGAFNTTTPSSSDVLTNAQHNSLGTTRTTLGSKSITLNNEYFYVAYPSSFGTTSQLKVNGLNFTDLASVYTINPFTNSSGGTASYYVYRTNNKLTGTYTMEVL